jgi:mannitol-1-/sugar-/sorbitol-6-phosphatase
VTRPAAALFDMDGTLVDSTATVELVWTEVAARHDLDAAEVLAVSHGVRAADTMREFLADDQIAEAVAWLEARELELVDGTVEVAGAGEYLARLSERGVPFGIVTSAPRPLAQARILAAGLELPDVLITAEDVAFGKPDPEGYRLAASRLGVEPAGCVVFEDADAGVRAGLAAGATVIVVGAGGSATAAGLRRIGDYRELFASASADPLGDA